MLKLMYITNRPDVAKIAESNQVDRIWVDLEYKGKKARQANVNSVISEHTLADIESVRKVLSKANLLVRVNPIDEDTKHEIDEVITRGADIVMLPMFHTAVDAAHFVDCVRGRAKVMLLVETIEAEKNLAEIVRVPGIDEIHIGLNDLHLEYKKDFMFELLANGKVDEMCSIIKSVGLPFGFGGIARLDEGLLPARHIIAEHYRLGSSMAILSRSFYDYWLEDEIEEIKRVFKFGITEIRDYEERLEKETNEYFERNRQRVIEEVGAVARKIRENMNKRKQLE